MAAAPIVHANTDKLDDYQIDNNDGIIAVGDIPKQPPHAPQVVNDTANDSTTGIDDDDDNNDNDDDNNGDDKNDVDDDNLLDEGDDNKPAQQ